MFKLHEETGTTFFIPFVLCIWDNESIKQKYFVHPNMFEPYIEPLTRKKIICVFSLLVYKMRCFEIGFSGKNMYSKF